MSGAAPGDCPPSAAHWLRVHDYLRGNRHDLAVQAAAGYPERLRLAGTPLLSPARWRPPAPVALADLRLEFRPDALAAKVPDVASLFPQALPQRPDGSRYGRFSEVIEALAAPAVFENRQTYRLVEADLASAGPSAGASLILGRGRFFDGVDVSGPAGHEYAAARLGLLEPGLPGPRQGLAGTCRFRAALADPDGFPASRAMLATSALTLRYDRATGTATFPLHLRDAAKVGHAGGLYQVIPVGIFQPSGEAPWNEANDFDLWRGLLREYAEEMLGADEDHGSETAPIDYDGWPLARALTDGLTDGTVRAWCLGMGADPLTFAVDLLAVVVIDAPLYDDLFSGMVADNAEGQVISPRPFDEPAVRALLDNAPLQAAGAALLTLALEQRDLLLNR
jgi:hypothetical protein